MLSDANPKQNFPLSKSNILLKNLPSQRRVEGGIYKRNWGFQFMKNNFKEEHEKYLSSFHNSNKENHETHEILEDI